MSDSEHDKIKKNSRKKKDPNAPKQATSAYQFFITAMHPVIKTEMPDLSPNEYFKVLGQRWKTLSEADKKAYLEKAELSKQQYQEKLKIFKASGTCEATPSSSPLISSFDALISQDISETPEQIVDKSPEKIEKIMQSDADKKSQKEPKHSKSKKRSAEGKEGESTPEASQEKKKKKKKKRVEEIQS